MDITGVIITLWYLACISSGIYNTLQHLSNLSADINIQFMFLQWTLSMFMQRSSFHFDSQGAMATIQLCLRSSFVWLLCIALSIAIACNTRYTNHPYASHTCVPEDASELAIWHVSHPQCVWRCLKMEQCRYTNYNMHSGQWELGLGQCVSLVKAPGVLVNAYGPERHTCLHWRSHTYEGLMPVETDDGFQHTYVARVRVADALVIGKFVVRNPFICVNNAGIAVVVPYNEALGHELLMVDPACSVAWLEYTSHDKIPIGTVIGGRLAEGSPTYVVMVRYGSNRLGFGYYDTTTGVANYESLGAQTSTTMKMLILLWWSESFCHKMQDEYDHI